MNVITRSKVRTFLLMKTDVGQHTYQPGTDLFSIFGILSAPKTLHCYWGITLRCVIPVVCVTNEREECVVNQHN